MASQFYDVGKVYFKSKELEEYYLPNYSQREFAEHLGIDRGTLRDYVDKKKFRGCYENTFLIFVAEIGWEKIIPMIEAGIPTAKNIYEKHKPKNLDWPEVEFPEEKGIQYYIPDKIERDEVIIGLTGDFSIDKTQLLHENNNINVSFTYDDLPRLIHRDKILEIDLIIYYKGLLYDIVDNYVGSLKSYTYLSEINNDYTFIPLRKLDWVLHIPNNKEYLELIKSVDLNITFDILKNYSFIIKYITDYSMLLLYKKLVGILPYRSVGLLRTLHVRDAYETYADVHKAVFNHLGIAIIPCIFSSLKEGRCVYKNISHLFNNEDKEYFGLYINKNKSLSHNTRNIINSILINFDVPSSFDFIDDS